MAFSFTKEIANILDHNEFIYDSIVSYVENENLFLDMLSVDEIKTVNLTPYKSKEYKENPFVKNIRLDKIRSNNVLITKGTFYKEQIFLDNTYTVSNMKETANLGYFDEDITFSIVYHCDLPWMSIIPSEINTMKDDIEKMSGNVLVLGCGLGYIAYMLSLKEEVKEITIIDRNFNIVNMFKKYILPQFETSKINIILDDAVDYVAKNANKYDYVYVDIWYNGQDGLPLYLKVKKIEQKYKDVKFLYWIEDEIIQQIRIGICEHIIEDNLSESEFKYLENVKTISDLFELLEINNIIQNYLPMCNFIL